LESEEKLVRRNIQWCGGTLEMWSRELGQVEIFRNRPVG